MKNEDKRKQRIAMNKLKSRFCGCAPLTFQRCERPTAWIPKFSRPRTFGCSPYYSTPLSASYMQDIKTTPSSSTFNRPPTSQWRIWHFTYDSAGIKVYLIRKNSCKIYTRSDWSTVFCFIGRKIEINCRCVRMWCFDLLRPHQFMRNDIVIVL